jgi:DNA-binding NarL/FixJ family response regulator
MTRKLKVLVASRSAEALRILSASLEGLPNIAPTSRLISNGHTDPLHDARPMPDVLVLRFDAESLAELESLSRSNPDTRPPLIVVGPAGSADAMRLAVRSGARDFLAEPLNVDDFVAAIERLRSEPRRTAQAAPQADVTLVLGAAGGVGTSFVACNLAHAMQKETGEPTLLLDLDVNSAPLTSFLDLTPERGLPTALSEVEYLDQHALTGYVTRHRSEGLLFTGDLATVDEEGYIFISGRQKDFIKTGGRRVSCRQIEEQLISFSELLEAAVIGIPDEVLGEAPKAFVVPRVRGAVNLADRLSQFCREQMSPHWIPKEIEFLDALPKNSAGKVLKEKLRTSASS